MEGVHLEVNLVLETGLPRELHQLLHVSRETKVVRLVVVEDPLPSERRRPQSKMVKQIRDLD